MAIKPDNALLLGVLNASCSDELKAKLVEPWVNPPVIVSMAPGVDLTPGKISFCPTDEPEKKPQSEAQQRRNAAASVRMKERHAAAVKRQCVPEPEELPAKPMELPAESAELTAGDKVWVDEAQHITEEVVQPITSMVPKQAVNTVTFTEPKRMGRPPKPQPIQPPRSARQRELDQKYLSVISQAAEEQQPPRVTGSPYTVKRMEQGLDSAERIHEQKQPEPVKKPLIDLPVGEPTKVETINVATVEGADPAYAPGAVKHMTFAKPAEMKFAAGSTTEIVAMERDGKGMITDSEGNVWVPYPVAAEIMQTNARAARYIAEQRRWPKARLKGVVGPAELVLRDAVQRYD